MPSRHVRLEGVFEGVMTWEEEELPIEPPIIEPPTGEHGYFDALAARPEATYINASASSASHHAWSLRDNAIIAEVTNKPPQTCWSYDYAGDPYPQKQDAAKFVLDPASLPEGHPDADPPRDSILLFPVGIDLASTDTLLITWDHFYGAEWRANIGDTGTWKHYNLYVGGGLNDRNPYLGPKIYWSRADETTGDGAGPASVGKHGQSILPSNRAAEVAGHDRTDGVVNTGLDAHMDGCVGKDGHFHVQREVWGRYWFEVHCGVAGSDTRFTSWKDTALYQAETAADQAAFAAGTWLCLSLWYADELRGPVRLLYGVPWIIREGMFSVFGFEFDSSAARSNLRGPLVGYWRNVVALRNYTSPGRAVGLSEEDALIFQRPLSPAVGIAQFLDQHLGGLS